MLVSAAHRLPPGNSYLCSEASDAQRGIASKGARGFRFLQWFVADIDCSCEICDFVAE